MSALLVDGVGWTLLHFLWQGALVAAGAALVLRALRGAHPGWRYATACIALLACLVWPAADLAGRMLGALTDSAEITLSDSLRGQEDVLRRSAAVDLAGGYLAYLIAAWSAGVLLLAVRSGAGLAWIVRRARGPAAAAWEQRAAALAARMGIRRPVRVRLADDLDTPVTALWRRPLILLPAALADDLPRAQLDALLAHELAHIRRHDYLANLLQNAIATLLFFHPAVWWLARRSNAERELLADALAARVLDQPRALAQALAELERQRGPRMALAQAACGGELVSRVRALVAPQAASFKVHLVAPALLLAIGGVTLAAQAASGAAEQALTARARVDFSSCAKPEWPAADLAAEHTGTVTLKFKVGRDGAVAEGVVTGSSGHPGLDEAARAGVMQCRFKPAQLNGMPVATWSTMQYVWTLQ